MRMLKELVIAAALGLASSAVLAQPSVPPQPAPGPTPDPLTGNSGIIVSAFDTARGLSIVQYLGLREQDFLPNSAGGNATPEAGLTLDFGTVSQWSTIFGTDSAVNANIQWSVSAFDGTTTNASDTYIGKSLITTFSSSPSAGVRNTAMNGAINAAVSFIAGGLDGSASCNGGNPCTATSSLDGAYAGANTWGPKYNNQLPVSAAGLVGTSMNFYLVAANSNSGLATLAPNTRYQNSTGIANWLLTADGHLTYTLPGGTTVPLPAAAWLLLSGLAGAGVLGRRRAAA